MPQTAGASFWVECDVKADIEKAGQDGLHHITLREAVVTDGHASKGAPCFEDNTGKVLHIKIDGENIPDSGTVQLHYRHYNAMGPNGVVNSETWTVAK